MGRSMLRRALLSILFVAVGYAGLSGASSAAIQERVEGVWDARTYVLADGTLHSVELNLSVGDAVQGLPEAPLRMIARHPEQAVPETARVTVEGDALTLLFPSGNRLYFEPVKPPSGQP